MQKQFIPAALALILALSAGSSYAPVNPPDNGGCPPLDQTGFVATGVFKGHPVDRNGDLIICMKTIVMPQLRMITAVIDNWPPLKGRSL